MLTIHVKHRYYQLAQLFFAGMIAAVLLSLFYPFVLRRFTSMVTLSPTKAENLLWTIESPILLVFIAAQGLFFLYFFILNRLNKSLKDMGQLGLGIFIGLLVSLFFLIRFLLYPTFSFIGFRSITGLLSALFNYTDGWRPEGAVFLFHLIAWFIILRASRDTLDFETVRRYFLGGLLLSLIATFLLVLRHPLFNRVGAFLFFLFLGSGLLTLTMARLDEKATLGSHSRGRSRPRSFFLQIGASLIFLGLFGFLATRIVNQSLVKRVLLGMVPIGRWFYDHIFWPFLLFLVPIFEFLFTLLERIIAFLFSFVPEAWFPSPSGDQSGTPELDLVDVGELLAEYAGFRYATVLLVLLAVAVILIGTIRRILLRQLANEAEEEDAAYGRPDGSLVQSGLNRLRQLFDRLRGLPPKPLLDIETIENMYANLCRIAARRGHERGVDQPPDRYLPQLQQVFPNSEIELQAITNAYMRAHYGEHHFSLIEMETLQRAYHEILQAMDREEEREEESAPLEAVDKNEGY